MEGQNRMAESKERRRGKGKAEGVRMGGAREGRGRHGERVRRKSG